MPIDVGFTTAFKIPEKPHHPVSPVDKHRLITRKLNRELGVDEMYKIIKPNCKYAICGRKRIMCNKSELQTFQWWNIFTYFNKRCVLDEDIFVFCPYQEPHLPTVTTIHVGHVNKKGK